MNFAIGFLTAVIVVKLLDAFSDRFKEDELAQEIVYNKGYDAGISDQGVRGVNG